MSSDGVESLVTEALRGGRPVILVAAGRSMEPTLPHGSRVRVVPSPRAPARPGQIVAVLRPDGGLALHRVVGVEPDGRVLTWGDAMRAPDPWGPRPVLGRVEVLDRPAAPRSLRRLWGHLRARLHVWRSLRPDARQSHCRENPRDLPGLGSS